MVAVGKVTPEQAKSMALPFPVLSDMELTAAKKYGLIHEKGYMLQDVSRPATFLLGPDRVIKWMRAADNIRPRPAFEEIFEAMRR